MKDQIEILKKKIEQKDAEIQDLNEQVHELCLAITQIVNKISSKTGHNE